MFGKINFLIKLTLAYVNRFKALILVGIIAGISIFFIASAFLPSLYHRTERIAVTGRYTSDELPDFILEKISDGLTKVDENGEISPSLASWTTTDKGITWIFTLKENLNWQDGKKLTSDSINYNFSDVQIEKPDNKTIVFKLKEAFMPFPSILTRPVFKKGLLGTGQWSVSKIKISGAYVSEISLINKEKDKIYYKFYPTYNLASIAYKLGQVDEVLSMLDKTEFASWSNTNIEVVPNKHQIVTLFFNNQDKALGQKALRQALTYAINKENLGVRALTPIPPDSWAYNGQVKAYNTDINHAKELMAEVPKDIRSDLKIRLTTSPDLLNIADQITKDWAVLGIAGTAQVSSIIPDEFQVFLTILDVPIDPDQYTLWHSTQTETNIAKYQSSRVDALLEQGRKEVNPDERKRIYLDFQRYLLEDLPAAFLIYPNYYTIIRK